MTPCLHYSVPFGAECPVCGVKVGVVDPKMLELARPFPSRYVKKVQGDDYVPHGIVEQRLVHIFGEPPKTELLREIFDADGTLTGVVMRMTVVGFKPVEEAGECDNPRAKTNGAKLKSAASDAYKRCAMRLTLGLHLWSQEDYFLYDSLTKKEAGDGSQEASQQTGPQQAHDVPSGPDQTPAAPAAAREEEPPVQPVTPPASGSGEAGSKGKDPASPSAGLVTKRKLLKALAKGKKVDLDALIKPIGKAFDDFDETDLDTLIDELKEAS